MVNMLTWGHGGVLALDLASVTGLAYGPQDAVAPVCATWHLPRMGGEGARYGAFENLLAEAMETLEPSHVILEAPLPLPAMNNRASAFQQITLRGICYSEAWRASCSISEIGMRDVRYALLGQNYSSEVGKKMVVAYCRKRGIKVVDHNAGDAAMVWLWRQAQLRRAPRVAGPLFAI